MAEGNDQQEKTEEPTPRYLEEALEQGNVPRSQELSGAVVLLVAAIFLVATGERFVDTMQGGIVRSISSLSDTPASTAELAASLRSLYPVVIGLVGPLLLLLALISLGISLLQVGGFRFSGKVLGFKPERLDPVRGLKRIFSLKGVVKTAGALARLMVILAVGGGGVLLGMKQLGAITSMPLEGAMARGASLLLWLFLLITVALFVLGILDCLYQRWQWRRDLRMSRQQVKDEHKQQEGDPEVKRRQRGRARELVEQSLSRALDEATVVVTNPTHVAVALQYEPGAVAAPMVVAKGLDHVAEEIKRLAREKSVPVYEQPTLARALYRDVALGQMIPESLYRAVANVLAFVQRLREQHGQGRR